VTNIGTIHTFQGKEAPVVFMVLGADTNSKGAATWAVNEANMMNVAATRAKKEFYIIVPYDTEQNRSVKNTGFLSFFTDFWQSINQDQKLWNVKDQLKNFSRYKKEVLKRVSVVQTWLENIWIRADPISKNELVTFLSDYYNPRLDSLNTMVWNIDSYNLND